LRPSRGKFAISTPPTTPDAYPNAPHWRRLEAEARIIALTMTDPERKRVMLFIASGYKLLAERAELRVSPER
jgi:plasmid stability protein